MGLTPLAGGVRRQHPHHSIWRVAVHRVDTHAQCSFEYMRVLHVPAERDSVEAMEQRDEATKSIFRGYVGVAFGAAEDSLILRKRLRFARFKNRRWNAVKRLFPVAIVWVSED